MINILDENSPFYYPLVLIDSGSYIFQSRYSTKFIYGYGLNSTNILKDHLRNNIPEIIIIFKDKTIFKKDQGVTDKDSGIVSLNLSSQFLSDLSNGSINDSINDKSILYDLSLRIYIVLFHKVLGHKKGVYIYIFLIMRIFLQNFFMNQKKKKL